MWSGDQSLAALIPAEQYVSQTWSWPHQTGTAGHIAGQWSGQQDCGFYWNAAVHVQRTWPNTRISCAKWEGREVFLSSVLRGACGTRLLSIWISIDALISSQLHQFLHFHLYILNRKLMWWERKFTQLPLQEKKSSTQLNWIELKCNQRTNTVYLMFSDNRLMLGIGGRSNTWKHMRLNFSLSLSQY